MVAVEIDHYTVLGLPSGEEGAKLSDHEIHKAYKSQALLLHPDKSRRRDDPNAHANFLQLQNSYQVLKDAKARKSFDDLLRIEREKKLVRQRDSKKRRRMMSDLEEAEERYYKQRDHSKPSNFGFGFGVDLTPEEEERYSRKLKEEIDRIIALHLKQKQAAAATQSSSKQEYFATDRGVNYNAAAAATQSSSSKQECYATDSGGKGNYNAAAAATQSSSSKQEYATYSGGNININDGFECREKVVQVSWEKTRVREDYTAQRLHEIFGMFGIVEDVVIRRKKGSALVVMASKDVAIAIVETAGYGLGDGSNPLRVELLQTTQECAKLGNLVGAGYRDYENSVLEKMRRKASKLG